MGNFQMDCICGHHEKVHNRPAPYGCTDCDCMRFRWEWLDWTSRALKVWDTVDAGERAA